MELRDYIQKTLTQVEAQVPQFTTSPDPARHFAAAGLMRCCALLRGVCVLEDAGLGALAGILERQHWETWLLSMHAVLRGDEALREIAGDDIKYKRLLSDKLALNIDYHLNWEGKTEKLNVFELSSSSPRSIKLDRRIASNSRQSCRCVARPSWCSIPLRLPARSVAAHAVC